MKIDFVPANLEGKFDAGSRMLRSYYSDTIDDFLDRATEAILGKLSGSHAFSLETTQRDAWRVQIDILKSALSIFRKRGSVYFEFSVPRLGKRIDVVVLLDQVIFVLEFKVGEIHFDTHARDQVWDYALDLKNFHETSHECLIIPVLIATESQHDRKTIHLIVAKDGLADPVLVREEQLPDVFEIGLAEEKNTVTVSNWEQGRYRPTPTIIEAAKALYSNHSVENISRSDAGAVNLTTTSETIFRIIQSSRENHRKSICFVTGVPGAGKTLVGLNVATKHFDRNSDLYSVYLSGNGPLVKVLCEALARDRVQNAKRQGQSLPKGRARSEVQAFIQNVHHFRDDCLIDLSKPPIEHVVLFDEAQRAWNRDQTASFMKRKKGLSHFSVSEPEFLISCMNRHRDWAVIVCLVGGGQEINTGESGIGEWIDSIARQFKHWDVYLSPQLQESEYAALRSLEQLRDLHNVTFRSEMHLAVSMRSFRAEHQSKLIRQILDLETAAAKTTYQDIASRFPIRLTRNLVSAKRWLRDQARGSERYGLIASSQAQRLKPHAIDVKSPVDPVHWFLDDKDDVRSSYYLEDVATEFHVQGLELDWTCVTWDADLRYLNHDWNYRSFRGNRWLRIAKHDRQRYLLNAYRVLLTRARQGMVIFVPPGDSEDPTRSPGFYDGTFDYLKSIGFEVIP